LRKIFPRYAGTFCIAGQYGVARIWKGKTMRFGIIGLNNRPIPNVTIQSDMTQEEKNVWSAQFYAQYDCDANPPNASYYRKRHMDDMRQRFAEQGATETRYFPLPV
jgi:hypothetical protein